MSADRHNKSLLVSLQLCSLLAIVVLAPLPFGGLHEWTWALLGFLVAFLLILSAVRTIVSDSGQEPHVRRLRIPAILYLLVIGWVALQASTLTPPTWHFAPWAEVAQALGVQLPGRLSLSPYSTQSELLKLMSYGGVFWLAVDCTRDRAYARRALWAFAIAATLYAVYGVVAALTDVGRTLWLHEMPHAAFVTSTFANRSMYAVFAGFGTLTIICLALDIMISHSSTAAQTGKPWRSILEAAPDRFLLLLMMVIVNLTALTMSGSRGAIFATATASVTLFLSLGRRKGLKLRQGSAFMIPIIALLVLWALVFILAGSKLGSRLPDTFSGDFGSRLAGYKMTILALADAPLTGFGAGAFKEVFFLYNAGEHWRTFNYPHNLYLGAAVELGIPAATALLCAIGLVAMSCLAGIKRRNRDLPMPALGFAASALVAFHGLVDSPLILPANAVSFSFLLGLAYGQSWPSSVRPTNASEPLASGPDAQLHPATAATQSE